MNYSNVEKLILKSLGPATKDKEFIARYVGGIGHPKRKQDEISKLEFLGIKLPVHWTAVKHLERTLDADNRWQLFYDVWKNTNSYDVRSVILLWMGTKKRKQERKENIKNILAMAEHIDNWALSDNLSMMMAELLEDDHLLFKHFLKWNRSKNPWLRRQSIVGIYGYARFRKKKFPVAKSLELVENLLHDPHFYVQRGVGWTLREIDRVDQKQQRKFVNQHLECISSTAWFAATELYEEKERTALVSARKKARLKRQRK